MTASRETALVASELSQTIAGKYLTFKLGGESYGIKVMQVREIIRLVAITAVPQLPRYIKGVINLRGRIIAVVDLRLKLGQAEVNDTEQTCIVVVQANLGKGQLTQVGLIVDAVEEVTHIGAAEIEETPDFGVQLDTGAILGMAKIKGVVKMLLGIDQVIGGDAALALAQAQAAIAVRSSGQG